MYRLPEAKHNNQEGSFPIPFIDQMLDMLAGHPHFGFLDGYSDYNQIAIALRTRKKPHSHALMAPLPSEGCHLGCAMLLLLFRGV